MSHPIPESFKAFRIHNDDDGYRAGIETVTLDDLSEGDVTIQGHWSSVNYKDALAGTGKGKIANVFPITGGIDVSGVVVASQNGRFAVGDEVLVTGCRQSQKRDGGYSEYLNVESDSLVALPDGLSLREAMAIGTAGFSAALGLYRMEANGQRPDMGPVVVTGATGGVGSFAVDIFTAAGYEVHAITGKVDEFDYLESLGAKQCISRHDLHWGQKPLETARWAGAFDNVGGDMLNGLTRVVGEYGNIVSCGLAGGFGLNTTVMPFILRGVSLLGVSSENCPQDLRATLWQRLASEWKPPHLDSICTREIAMDGLMDTFESMLTGRSFGRTVVKLN
ncbi:oxidoreductase [Marinihelvus fidelis]|nr:oxidoreductase [Marinihelvus fidelis]